MLPDPLHPAIVHFPIVLAVLLVPIAVAALIVIARGAPPRKAWSVVVLTSLLVGVSAWQAEETGEDDEEAVEELVAHEVVEEHEERGKRFVQLATGVLLLSAAGLLGGKAGRIARPLGALASVGLAAAVLGVAKSGGEIVYGPQGLVDLSGADAEAGGHDDDEHDP